MEEFYIICDVCNNRTPASQMPPSLHPCEHYVCFKCVGTRAAGVLRGLAPTADDPAIMQSILCCPIGSTACRDAALSEFNVERALQFIGDDGPALVAALNRLSCMVACASFAPAESRPSSSSSTSEAPASQSDIREDDDTFGGIPITRCPKDGCGSIWESMPDTGRRDQPNITEKDEKGNVLTREAWQHYCDFRDRCRDCDTNFCKSCKAVPYHLGRTCEAQQRFEASRVCRFCEARGRTDGRGRKGIVGCRDS